MIATFISEKLAGILCIEVLYLMVSMRDSEIRNLTLQMF